MKNNVQKRKGFALLLTLAVLLMIISLSAVIVTLLNTAKKDGDYSHSLIQANLIYSDIGTVFKNGKDLKDDFYTMIYSSPIPINNTSGEFSMIMDCHPSDNRVNINWISPSKEDKTAQYEIMANKIFSFLVDKYEVSDSYQLQTIIIDAINKKNYHENKETKLGKSFKNGIVSFKDFTKILNEYILLTDDYSVLRIPWKTYFTFIENNYKGINGKYMPSELISSLFDLELSVVEESWIPGTRELNDFAKEFGATVNKKIYEDVNSTTHSKCSVVYDYRKERYRFDFRENKGEVNNFEFYGKQ